MHEPVATRTLSLDTVFDILSNRRRRFALYHLHDQRDAVATVTEIARTVAQRERTYCAGDDPGVDSIVTELVHVHFPALEGAGIVEFDQRSETVRYHRQPSLEEWLEHAFHVELAEP